MNLNIQSIRKHAAVTGLLAALCFSAGAAFADDAAQPGGKHPEMRERMEKMCQDNPQRCEEMKQKMQQRKAECDKDPVACKQKHEEMREKLKARMEEKCKANPEKCEEWKKNHPHAGEHGDHGDRPAPPPTK